MEQVGSSRMCFEVCGEAWFTVEGLVSGNPKRVEGLEGLMNKQALRVWVKDSSPMNKRGLGFWVS